MIMAAWTIFIIVFVLCLVGIVTISLNVAVNEIINIVNPYITAGSVSDQFVTYWDFIIGLLRAFAVLSLIALTAWAVVRAIERRQESP